MDEESCGGIVFYKHMSVESTFEPACIRASMFGGVPRTLIAQKEVKEEREKGKGKEDENKINHCQTNRYDGHVPALRYRTASAVRSTQKLMVSVFSVCAVRPKEPKAAALAQGRRDRLRSR